MTGVNNLLGTPTPEFRQHSDQQCLIFLTLPNPHLTGFLSRYMLSYVRSTHTGQTRQVPLCILSVGVPFLFVASFHGLPRIQALHPIFSNSSPPTFRDKTFAVKIAYSAESISHVPAFVRMLVRKSFRMQNYGRRIRGFDYPIRIDRTNNLKGPGHVRLGKVHLVG